MRSTQTERICGALVQWQNTRFIWADGGSIPEGATVDIGKARVKEVRPIGNRETLRHLMRGHKF